MAFVKKTWSLNDTVYPDDMNNIEGGIADANSGKNILDSNEKTVLDDTDLFPVISESTLYKCTIGKLVNKILLLSYPVGSLYWSSKPTNPATLFGGTWAQITDKFVLAAGSTFAINTTGGSKDAVVVTHTHSYSGVTTDDTLSNHHHGGKTIDATGGGSASRLVPPSFTGGTAYSQITDNDGNHRHNYSGTVNAPTGAVAGTNANMPPYITRYCWERTA